MKSDKKQVIADIVAFSSITQLAVLDCTWKNRNFEMLSASQTETILMRVYTGFRLIV